MIVTGGARRYWDFSASMNAGSPTCPIAKVTWLHTKRPPMSDAKVIRSGVDMVPSMLLNRAYLETFQHNLIGVNQTYTWPMESGRLDGAAFDLKFLVEFAANCSGTSRSAARVGCTIAPGLDFARFELTPKGCSPEIAIRRKRRAP